LVVVLPEKDSFATKKETGEPGDYLTARPAASSASSDPDSADKEAEEITRSFHLTPRGGLDTIVKLVGSASASASSTSWLRQRNPLLRDISAKPEGGVRVLLCENGACKEDDEGVVEAMRRVNIGGGEEKEKEKEKEEEKKKKKKKRELEREEEERLWGPKTPAADVATLEA